jgi:predicted DNA-binding transcriptional regulator AlpA
MSARDQTTYLVIADLMQRYQCSRMWIVRRMASSTHPFPQPTKFGGGRNCVRRWRPVDVERWDEEERNNQS